MLIYFGTMQVNVKIVKKKVINGKPMRSISNGFSSPCNSKVEGGVVD